MNRKLLLIFLLFICPYFINNDEVDECISNFEAQKKSTCESLTGTQTSYTCSYSYSSYCLPQYECESYTPETGDLSKVICQDILTPKGKICTFKDGKNKCEEIVCGDEAEEISEDICSNIKFKSDETDTNKKRCVHEGNKCKVYYNKCNDINNEVDCNSNKPQSPAENSCSWDGEKNKCNPVIKECSQYAVLRNSGVLCKQLVASDNTKECVLENDVCVEKTAEIAGCNLYTGNVATECEGYLPVIKPDDDSKDNYIPQNYRCEFNDGKNPKCYPILKPCSDYKNEGDCNTYSTVVQDPTKTRCFFEDGHCKEKPIICEAADSTNCNSITPYIVDDSDYSIVIDEHSVCKYDSSCIKVDRECNNITTSNLCNAHVFTDSRKDIKKCVYKGSTCKEVYKTCDIYEEKATTKAKEDCEDIFIEDTFYSCSFEDNKCKTVEKKNCEDGNGNNCGLIKLYNKTFYCIQDIEDTSKCKEQFRECNSNENDRNKCESNIPYNAHKQCILKHDSECVLTTKKCDDANDVEECKNYEPYDTINNECIYDSTDLKCIELPKQFNYCSDYTGKDPTICQSINPLNSEGKSYSYPVKCNIVENKCKLIEKCEDVESKEECFAIKLKDTNKICYYDNTNNECIEQYKDCSSVNSISTDAEKKTTCVNLKVETCSYDDSTKKCSSDEKCAPFNVDLLAANCLSLTTSLNDKTKKCQYASGSGRCSKTKKNCLEIKAYLSNLTNDEKKDLCKNEKVEECNLNICKESEQEQSTDTSKTNGDNNNNQNNDSGNDNGNNSNYSRRQYLNKLFILILCLLF